MKNLKKISVLFLLFLVLNVLYACSKKDSSSNTSSMLVSTPESVMMGDYGENKETSLNFTQTSSDNVDDDKLEEPSMNTSSSSVSSNRKLIRRIQMSVETLEFDNTMDFIMDEVNRLGGYSESSHINGSGYNHSESRYASLTLRIPSNQVEQLLSLVGKQTNVLSKKETTEDVTLSYVDTKSRVKSLEIQQERLLTLLEKSDSLDNIIMLEQRLSEVRYEIEEYASRLRTYDNLVEYSTLSIDISEVNKITPIETKGIIDRMGTGITKSLGNVYNGIINFIVWFVVNIPYIIIWVGIIFIGFIIYIKIKRVHMNTILKNSGHLPEVNKETSDEDKK